MCCVFACIYMPTLHYSMHILWIHMYVCTCLHYTTVCIYCGYICMCVHAYTTLQYAYTVDTYVSAGPCIPLADNTTVQRPQLAFERKSSINFEVTEDLVTKPKEVTPYPKEPHVNIVRKMSRELSSAMSDISLTMSQSQTQLSFMDIPIAPSPAPSKVTHMRAHAQTHTHTAEVGAYTLGMHAYCIAGKFHDFVIMNQIFAIKNLRFY